MEPQWFLASRRIWAAIASVIAVLIPVLGGFGVTLPEGFAVSLDSIVQAVLGSVAAVLVLLSSFSPSGKSPTISGTGSGSA